MRLQLAVVACALAAVSARPVDADDVGGSARARVAAFSDGSVSVLAPAFEGQIDAGDAGRWHASSHVDIVSGATRAIKSDLVSGATRFVERRSDLAVGWRSTAGPRELLAALAGSVERDFSSLSGRVGGRVEAWARRSSVELSFGGSLERLWLPGEAPAWRGLGSVVVDATAAHLLSPALVLHTALTLRHHRCDATVGCAASPYRAVALRWRDGDRTSIRERHPARRTRLGGRAGLSLAPRAGLGLHALLEPAWDDWGVSGGSAVLAAAVDGGADRWHARVEVRGGWLGAASFFRRVDDTVSTASGEVAPAYRSGDRRLGGVGSVGVGGELSWPLPYTLAGMRLSLLAHANLVRQRWRGIANALGATALSGGLALEGSR